MKFDIFFSICQTPVNGYMPSERVMWENFFDQARLADTLGFGTAWIAETHLSCQVQKQNADAVIPHFEGEIGLNTDILQLAHKLFAVTARLHIGSAIRNILCNGGPLAHAEAIRTFLSLHGLNPQEQRKLHIGFAAGRFPFSNVPYGIRPRSAVEAAAWPVIKGKILLEATEIFLRFLRGDVFESTQVRPKIIGRDDFRSSADWQDVLNAHGAKSDTITIPPFWIFDKVGIVPRESPLHLLALTLGSQDATAQDFANTLLPVGVFNLSITPGAVIESTHARMQKNYHHAGGPWRRDYMPRTTLVFIDDTPGASETAKNSAARARAQQAISVYWQAMEGTLDQQKIDNAVDNALVGSPAQIAAQIADRFHPEDRLMLWFDFFNHDNAAVKKSMQEFMRAVAPHCSPATVESAR